MDERHWWIAQRIGQAFNIDTTQPADNSFLESFICNSVVLEKINNFLCINGSNKLFFCCLKDEISQRNLTVIDSLLKLPKELNADNTVILYFVRHDTNQEVSQTQIFKEVFCGEIKNASQILFNVYNEFFMPMFKANKDWSNCTEDYKIQVVHNVEKMVSFNKIKIYFT